MQSRKHIFSATYFYENFSTCYDLFFTKTFQQLVRQHNEENKDVKVIPVKVKQLHISTVSTGTAGFEA